MSLHHSLVMPILIPRRDKASTIKKDDRIEDIKSEVRNGVAILFCVVCGVVAMSSQIFAWKASIFFANNT